MPTLEDTAVDFPVTTLNDLLEIEAKAGVTGGADEDKYRRWAFLSTGAAGLLALILAVVLITDGGGGGGSAAKAKDYPGKPVKNTVKLAGDVPSNVKVDTEVSLYKGGELIVAPAIVSQITTPKAGSVDTSPSVELAMTDEQGSAFIKAFTKGTEKGRIQAYSPGQPTAPAGATPAPAPTDSTAPAATTETTAPAATTETTPAATTETTAPPPVSG